MVSRRSARHFTTAWLCGFCGAVTRGLRVQPTRPFRRSLPMTLAFRASAIRPPQVLTGRTIEFGPARTGGAGSGRVAGMVRASSRISPYRAAGLAWSGDLPRQLPQVLFYTADSILS